MSQAEDTLIAALLDGPKRASAIPLAERTRRYHASRLAAEGRLWRKGSYYHLTAKGFDYARQNGLADDSLFYYLPPAEGEAEFIKQFEQLTNAKPHPQTPWWHNQIILEALPIALALLLIGGVILFSYLTGLV